MAAGRPPLLALLALGLTLASAPLAAQRPAPFPPAQRFDPIPRTMPPLHLSGETRIRLREASIEWGMVARHQLQAQQPAPSRSPERIRRAVVTLTGLAASAMLLLLIAAWLFFRRRQS